jgi:hypothetical protein
VRRTTGLEPARAGSTHGPLERGACLEVHRHTRSPNAEARGFAAGARPAWSPSSSRASRFQPMRHAPRGRGTRPSCWAKNTWTEGGGRGSAPTPRAAVCLERAQIGPRFRWEWTHAIMYEAIRELARSLASATRSDDLVAVATWRYASSTAIDCTSPSIVARISSAAWHPRGSSSSHFEDVARCSSG